MKQRGVKGIWSTSYYFRCNTGNNKIRFFFFNIFSFIQKTNLKVQFESAYTIRMNKFRICLNIKPQLFFLNLFNFENDESSIVEINKTFLAENIISKNLYISLKRT